MGTGRLGGMPRVLAVVVATAILLLMVLWALQRQLIYFPSPGPVPAAAQALDRGRDVTLRTSDGLTLGAWYVPARGAGEATVLVANGNGGDRSLRAPLARALSGHGIGVLLFDYRGYAGNPGSPSEKGLALDVRAARDHLVDEAGVPPDRLLYLGESLGSAVVTELAAEHPPAGLVLRSPFTDLASVGRVHYPFLPVRALLRDRFPVAERIARVQAPTVVVYGGADSIVPPSQSRAVAEAAADLREVVEVPGADHNDRALLDGPELVGAVVRLAR
jgi:fermentation-respiration switch protein FrsA (DUF1100 family)